MEFVHNFSSDIKLGGGKLQRAERKGVIAVHAKGGNKMFIGDVYYVLNLSTNLLSVGTIVEKRLFCAF